MSQEEGCTIERIRNYLLNLQEDLDKTPLSKEASGNNNNEDITKGSEKKSPKKRASWFGPFNRLCKTKDKGSSHGRDSRGSQGGSTKDRNVTKNRESAKLEVRKLKSDIRQMINAFNNLNDFQNEISNSLKNDPQLNKLKVVLEKASSMNSQSHDLKEIRRKVFTLKSQIPSLLYKQTSKEMMISGDSQTTEDYSEISETGSDLFLPSLHVSGDFRRSPAFEEVLDKFKNLKFTHKLCLLSFAVFPENREVYRRMLKYWWIGEGYISCDGSENHTVKQILGEFSKNGLLEPVEDESILNPISYKMEPHVHSAVIHLANSMDLFKLYDDKGKSYYKKTGKEKVCLVRGSSLQQDTKTKRMKPENLETVFNSSERYPDFTFKWFPSMKELKVLYLGRWERTAKRHIEVESTEFLKDIEKLKKVKLVSFQGISRIEKLENPICLLPELLILDLKACYNLQTLPSDIGLLQKLIYLDVSECYMLDGMPNGIKNLSSLQVLKGFVIGETDNERNCAVKHLTKLRKLSITVNKYTFKVEYLAESLKDLKHLQSLKIAWGARFPDTEENETETIQNKPDNQEVKSNVEGDGDKGKFDPEEGKNKDEVGAEISKSDKVFEGEKTSPPQDVSDMIQEKPDDRTKVQKEDDGANKEKADLDEGKKQNKVEAEKTTSAPQESKDMIDNKTDDQEEGKKHDEAEAGIVKPNNDVEGVKKASPVSESTEAIQNNRDDQEIGDKQTKKGDEEKEKEKDNQEEGKKHDEVEAGISKSNNGVEGVKKASPVSESTEAIQNKDDQEIGDKQTKKGDEEKEKEKDNKEERKKHDEVEAGISKSNNGEEGVKKASPVSESTEAIQNNRDDQEIGYKQTKKGDEEKEKEKDNQEERKKRDEVEAGISKSNNGEEGVKKASPVSESTEAIQNNRDDQEIGDKQTKKGDEEKEKEKDNQEERKKHDEVEAGISKSNNAEGVKKASPVSESTEAIQNNRDDQEIGDKQTKKGDEEKEKDNQEERKKHDEVEAEISKSNNGVEGAKKASPVSESTEAIQNNRYDQEIGDKQTNKGDDEKEKDNQEGKKHDEVEAGISKSNNGVEGVKKASPASESTEAIQNKRDDHKIGDKQAEKGDEEPEKANQEEERTRDDVEAGISKSNSNDVEGVKKASLSRESTQTIENKPDDHEIGDKREEKGDEEKKKANQEEGKKKYEVEADSSKPDKVIEKSKEIVQSNPDDHREIRKVQEKGEGEKKGDNTKMVDEGVAKTQKSHKAIKFGKILSFSGKSKALIQKKRDDLKGDNALTEENYETQSPSRPSKDPRSIKANWFKGWGQQTKRWGIGSPESEAIDHTPKLPSTLKKLELECFPEKEPPKWLNPKYLNNLEKLSIKGGWLSHINTETAENKWAVQILRLKYLHKFKVEWKDLQTQFPQMKLLEKYECPFIAFCPTDGNGVWRKPHIS